MAHEEREKTKTARPGGGGAATGSGMNFQAVATAIAGVHLLAGIRLGWLDGLVDDTPVAVWAETGGPGDDIRLELDDRTTVEVQAKRGARADRRLWASLMSLAHAIVDARIGFGVVVVSPDSSHNVAYKLARGIRRLADGRIDGLDATTQKFRGTLDKNDLSPKSACQKLRIVVVHGIDGDSSSVTAAKALLKSLVCDRHEVDRAWDLLYREATAIIERRGRWDASAIHLLFQAEGIKFADASSPAGVLAKLTHWVVETNRTFSIPAIGRPLPIDDVWLPLQLLASDGDLRLATDAADALAQYHAVPNRDRPESGRTTSDAAWVGRFHRLAVVSGGPGLGKTTLLTKVARVYATDGVPVLKVRLSAVAARMAKGDTFADSVFQLGLDGADVLPAEARNLRYRNWVLLCDGLDECHDYQDPIAKGLQQFAAGNPGARIVVTTRPVGYATRLIADWRHYELLPPESRSAPDRLATIIRAALPADHAPHLNAPEIVRRELKACAASDVICRSPLLLGLAASLLVNGRHLSASKTRLYADLFELMTHRANPRPTSADLSDTLLTRTLDVLGRLLVCEPLATVTATLDRAATVLEVELAITNLSARELAERCLRHWEAIGLVERIHHGLDPFPTFVHRTFAEFAAARHLTQCSVAEQESAIAEYVEHGSRGEVLAFASALGPPDIVVSRLAAHAEGGATASLEQALRIIAAPDARVEEHLHQRVLKWAFDTADHYERDEAFVLGSALADTARSAPDLLGTTAAAWLRSARWSTRLIAWTCAVEAGPQFYDVDEAAAEFRGFARQASPGLDLSVHGMRALERRGDDELLARLALGLVRRLLNSWPAETVDRYVSEVLADAPFASIAFRSNMDALYHAKGRDCPLPNESWGSSSDLLRRFLPGSEHSQASRQATRALLLGVAGLGDAGGPSATLPRPALQLSAYLEISRFGAVSANDVWAWTTPYDPAVVKEVMGTLAAISPLDEHALAAEARAALRQLEDMNPDDSNPVWSSRASLDVPQPDWSAVKTIDVDWQTVERAFNHGSLWLVQAAVNLYCGRGAITPPKARQLLAQGRGYGLAAAAHVACELEPAVAVDLLLASIDERDIPGKQYLFDALTRLTPPWNERLRAAVRSGLMGSDAPAAQAAAALANASLARGDSVEAALLEVAHVHWHLRERANRRNDRSMPESPRQSLLEGMLSLGVVDDARLIVFCGDERWDVAGVANDALLERIAGSVLSRARFVDAVARKALPALLLSRAHAQDVPFTPTEVQRLLSLVTDEDIESRLAIANLLDSSSLSDGDAAQVGGRLLNDLHPEVRRAARRALDNGGSVTVRNR